MKKLVLALALSVFAVSTWAGGASPSTVEVVSYKSRIPKGSWQDGGAGHALGCFILEHIMKRQGC